MTAEVQQLVERPEAANVVPLRDEPTSIIAIIAKAATDPNCDIDKFERLMAMHDRLAARDAKTRYDAAMAEMQPELPVIGERGGIKDRAGEVQSTYARWEDINAAIKPILAKHGFALTFRTGRTEQNLPTVTGVLSHNGGHTEETTIELPVDTSGSKNAVQAVGSSTSYGQRYTAKLLLNLTSRGEDDDGQAGGQGAAEGAAIAAINFFNTVDEFSVWKRDQWPGVEKILSGPERNRVVAHFNLRRKRVIEAAKGEGAGE